MKKQTIKVKKEDSKNKLQTSLDKLSFSHDLKVAAFQLLNSHDINTRIAAAYKLGRSENKQVGEILHRALKLETSEHVTDEILSSIGTLNSQESVDELFEFLIENSDPKLRKKAVVILAILPDPKKILDGIESLLLHEIDEGLKAEIIWLLGRIGEPQSLRSLEKIIFFDKSFQVKKSAIESLLKLKDSKTAKEILERALVEINEKNMRRELLWHYSKISDFDEEKLLKVFETEDDIENQRLLVWLISFRKKPEIITKLITSCDPNLHHPKVIREINTKIIHHKDKFSQDHLLDILEFSPNPTLKQNAVEVLNSNLSDIDLARLVRIKENETDENLKAELEQLLRLI